MKSISPILFIIGVLIACVICMPVRHVGAQDEKRGLALQAPTEAERRIALVIGNSSYKDSPLLNPVNDARAIAAALRGFGFEVIYGENLSHNDMKRNARAFGAKIRNGGVGLFYYAGHGIQINGRNYLIPVDAVITGEEEVEDEAYNVGGVLAQMAIAHNRLNIVILDACRNNPFARSFRSINNGLASIDAPSGTLIAYATAPGSVASDGEAKNGLYTQELLGAMKVPNLKIEDVFKRVRAAVQNKTAGKQVPWEASSLIGDFAFAGQLAIETAAAQPLSFADPKTSAPAPNESSKSGIDPATIELSFWDSIKSSIDSEDYKAYLEKYPSGTFVALARNKLRNLEATAKPLANNTTTPAEPKPEPTREIASPPAKIVTIQEIELSFKSNLFDETIKNARIFLETTPDSKEAHTYLGISLLVRKDIDNAVMHLEKAVRLGEPMSFPVKRLREPLLGHAFDDVNVIVTLGAVTIKSGKTSYQANFAALSEFRLENYNNTCPIVFLKGAFTETSENSQKSKQGVKQFNLFPPSATLQQVNQNNMVYNLAACNDEGILTIGVLKLMNRLMVSR